MQKSYLNKLICICMALMFAIAVIGSSNGIESSSRKLPVSARQNAFCERNADDGTAQGLRLVSMCEDMDDFQMFTDTAGTTLNVLAGLRTAIFVILAAALFCAFIPHPPPFPPRSIPTTSRGQLFRTDFSYPPRSTPPGMCGSTERRRRPVRDAIPPASPSTPQSDGKGRPHRAGMINRPRVREALHTQTDEPAPGKGGSK